MVDAISPIEISSPSKVYKPVGRCIYCRRRATKLTKEHIIPFGLAADSLVLPTASCRKCAEKTRDFETVCLRHMWWPFRTRLGVPTRGKETPDSFLVRKMMVEQRNADGLIEYQKIAETPVSVNDYPLFYYAFDFPPTGTLVGRPDNEDFTYYCWVAMDMDDFGKYAQNDREGFRIGPRNTEHFCKLLAKIAHAYSVAELGLDTFEPFLTRYIRGSSLHPRAEPQWIGGDHAPNCHTPREKLHEIGWEIRTIGDTSYVTVRIRLFCFIGTPSYRVVTGKLRSAPNKLSFLTQPLYTIDIKSPFPTLNLSPITDAIRGTRG